MERERGGVIVHDDSFFSFSPSRTPSHPVYIHSRYTRTRPSSVFIADKQRVYWPWDALSPFFGSTFFSTSAGLYPRKIVIIERDYSHMNMNGKNSPHGGKVFFLYLRKKKNLGN